MVCCGVHGAVYWIFLQLSLLLVLAILACSLNVPLASIVCCRWKAHRYEECWVLCAINMGSVAISVQLSCWHRSRLWADCESTGRCTEQGARAQGSHLLQLAGFLSLSHIDVLHIHLYLRLVETSQTTVHYEVSYAMYKTPVMSEHCKMRLCRKLVHWSSLPTQPIGCQLQHRLQIVMLMCCV